MGSDRSRRHEALRVHEVPSWAGTRGALHSGGSKLSVLENEVSQLFRPLQRISYHDPFVPDCEIDEVRYQGEELSDELLGESDLVLILTDHRGIDYENLVAKSSRVFDTRTATQHVHLEDPDWRARVTKL